MTSGEKIEPHRVTKPIQLLAAWLVGLVVIDGAFLTGAVALAPGWASELLVVAAILNVPVFLVALFVLQTRFRPELQEDTYYFQYISQRGERVTVDRNEIQDSRIDALSKAVEQLRIADKTIEARAINSPWLLALNDYLEDFSEIREALLAAGFRDPVQFGKSRGSKPPGRRIIAINEAADIEFMVGLLRALNGFPFEGFVLWVPVRDAGETEDVYIGAYGVTEQMVPLTPGLKAKIDTGVSASEFRQIIRASRAS